ncbi:MAG: aspartyl protease family protein [Acidobacteria bacterium]|nr:aspartyl protease family protein [Acidobacteriota bacterium]
MMIDPKHIHGWGLNVVVNGKTSRLMLDTGASGLLLSRKAAERAGITYVSDMKFSGFGDKGPQGGHVAFAESIKIGDLEFRNCAIGITEQARVLDDDGLIGADVFSHYLVDIDFPDHQLKLTPLPKRPEDIAIAPATLQTEGTDSADAEKAAAPDVAKTDAKDHGPIAPPHKDSGPQDRYVAPEMKSYTSIFRFGHQLLISTRVNGGPAGLFLIDTGSTNSLISPEAAREVTKVHQTDRVQVKGLSGKVQQLYTADKAVLQFARFKQENLDLISFDLSKMSRSTGVEVSGVLGYSVLGFLDIKIDYRDGLVDFSYDPSHWR